MYLLVGVLFGLLYALIMGIAVAVDGGGFILFMGLANELFSELFKIILHFAPFFQHPHKLTKLLPSATSEMPKVLQ